MDRDTTLDADQKLYPMVQEIFIWMREDGTGMDDNNNRDIHHRILNMAYDAYQMEDRTKWNLLVEAYHNCMYSATKRISQNTD